MTGKYSGDMDSTEKKITISSCLSNLNDTVHKSNMHKKQTLHNLITDKS